MVNFLVEYWWIVVVLIAAVAVATAFVIRFVKTPTSEQMARVKSWLLNVVTQAEREYKSGTGKIKLSFCYNSFVAAWPTLAKIISFETFSSLVDEVLTEFKSMLSSNASLQEYVNETSTVKESDKS